MFDPKSNRLIYGDLLAPPPGYNLGMAVCTTYSLDLETLIASLVAIGLNEATDTELLRNPVNTLHAIERVSKKIVVFCEAGQTRIPTVSSPLHLLLEKMIVPIALPESYIKGQYPSFHPKTWVIQYVSKNQKPIYRFLVMSRNLTFDRSWDVSVALEGKKEPGGKTKVRPLLDFLGFLRDTISSQDPDRWQKRGIVDNMYDALQEVRFRSGEDVRGFKDDSFEILPLGIYDEPNAKVYDKDPLFDMFNDTPGHGIHDMVIISPFISKGAIKKLDADSKWLTKSSRRVLITRREELSKLKGALHNTDVYVMQDAIVNGENELSEDGETIQPKKQDIHAKLYLSVKDSQVNLCLGSMNASEKGLGVKATDKPGLLKDSKEAVVANVEMMLRLSTSPYYLNKLSLLKDLMGEDDKSNPFICVDPDTEKDEGKEDKENPNEKTFKRVCRLRLKGEVIPSGDNYDITLTCSGGAIPSGVKITPLRAKKLSRDLDKTVSFPNLRLLDLSEFYTVTIGEGDNKVQGLILVPTKGIPEDREKGIITDIISDQKKFAEYVAISLGESPEQFMIDVLDSEDKKKGEKGSGVSPSLTALYERMLRVACDEPERLKDIQRLVRLIDDEKIVTPEFKDMYRTFMSALKYKYDG